MRDINFIFMKQRIIDNCQINGHKNFDSSASEVIVNMKQHRYFFILSLGYSVQNFCIVFTLSLNACASKFDLRLTLEFDSNFQYNVN